MKKQLTLLVALVLLVGAVLSGCQQAPAPAPAPAAPAETPAETPAPAPAETPAEEPAPAEQANIVRHNLGANPESIDPALNTAVDGAIVLVNAFEGLTKYDTEGAVIGGVAENWDISEDLLTYTFHLRPSNWSDGQPVTANDFLYAWQRALDPMTAAEYAYQLYYIKNAQPINNGEMGMEELGVKVIDDMTLEVTLESPTPYFLELTAFPTLYPVRKDVIEANGDQWTLSADTFISNGPFKLQEWAINDVMKLVKNENYRDAANVKLDGIDFYFITEASVALPAYQAGELDYNETIPQDQIPTLTATEPDFAIHPYLGTYFYVFNVEAEPVDDPLVRKALSLAIDRKTIVDVVAQGGQTPATGYVPYGLLQSDGKDFREVGGDYGITPDNYAANLEEAKQLLADAGYPNGEGFPTVEFVYNTSEGHKAIAEAVQNMWQQGLGINIELRNEEWAVFQNTRQEGDFTIARHGWIGDYGDPMTFLDMWYSTSGNNDSQWNNPEFDRLINESRLNSGADRDAILHQAEDQIFEQNIVAPIYYYTKPALIKGNLKDAYMSILGYIYYENAYYE